MPQRDFVVTAIWDDEAEVWVSESDISGLHIEAATLEEFQREVREHAAELIVENHYRDVDLSRETLSSLIPTIFYKTATAA